jgi:hypothetical protein
VVLYSGVICFFKEPQSQQIKGEVSRVFSNPCSYSVSSHPQLECNQGEKGVNIDQRGRVNDVYRVTTIGLRKINQ